MNLRFVVVTVVAIGLAVAGWFHRGAGPLAGAVRAMGLPTDGAAPQTVATLRAAGVHKCVGARGTAYIDGACLAGSREVAANGGTLTVTSFPKSTPSPSSLASGALGGPLVKPLDPDERDRLRDKAVDDAANRR